MDRALLLLCSALLVGACGSGTLSASAGVQVESRASTVVLPLEVESVTPAAGVTVATGECEAGADEVCNALDDNCDGVVDEGCGVASGEVQITATWNSGADIDLYVVDPSEEVLSFQRRRSLSGGHLDHDARGDCREGQVNERLENAVWTERPPEGLYKVQLHYLFECDSGAGLTTATVSVAVGGRVIGSWNQRIAPNETADVVAFRLAAP